MRENARDRSQIIIKYMLHSLRTINYQCQRFNFSLEAHAPKHSLKLLCFAYIGVECVYVHDFCFVKRFVG